MVHSARHEAGASPRMKDDDAALVVVRVGETHPHLLNPEWVYVPSEAPPLTPLALPGVPSEQGTPPPLSNSSSGGPAPPLPSATVSTAPYQPRVAQHSTSPIDTAGSPSPTKPEGSLPTQEERKLRSPWRIVCLVLCGVVLFSGYAIYELNSLLAKSRRNYKELDREYTQIAQERDTLKSKLEAAKKSPSPDKRPESKELKVPENGQTMTPSGGGLSGGIHHTLLNWLRKFKDTTSAKSFIAPPPESEQKND
jgi:hypothetical protein